jgi:hypothetical protein
MGGLSSSSKVVELLKQNKRITNKVRQKSHIFTHDNRCSVTKKSGFESGNTKSSNIFLHVNARMGAAPSGLVEGGIGSIVVKQGAAGCNERQLRKGTSLLNRGRRRLTRGGIVGGRRRRRDGGVVEREGRTKTR